MTDPEKMVYAAAFAASFNNSLRGIITPHSATRAAEDASYAVSAMRGPMPGISPEDLKMFREFHQKSGQSKP